MILSDIVKACSFSESFYKESMQKSYFYFFRFSMFSIFLYSILFMIIKPEKNDSNQSSDIITIARSYFNGRIPTFVVKNGIISCPSIKQPFLSSRISDFQVLIDTSGELKTLRENVPSGLLISRQFILLKLNYKRQIPISAIQINQTLGQNTVIIDDKILNTFEPYISKITWLIRLSTLSWKQTLLQIALAFLLAGLLYGIMQIYQMSISFRNIWKTTFLTMVPSFCVTLFLVRFGFSESISMLFQAVFMFVTSFKTLTKQKKIF